jgi:hypothetical protein
MVALEIRINGKVAYTIGVGARGTLSANVSWVHVDRKAGPPHEEAWLSAQGSPGVHGEPLSWPHTSLAMGDEVTIRLIESEQIDEGLPLPSPIPP